MDLDKHRGGNKQGWWKTKIDFGKCGGWNKRGGWNIFMKSVNVEGEFFLCGGWNFSKLVSEGPTFIRDMRVPFVQVLDQFLVCGISSF